jgi:predicted RNA methylase
MTHSPHKRLLGQYFTPVPVIQAAYAMLDVLSKRRPDQTVSVIDPACGDGAFLRYAIQHGIAAKKNTIGIDCDYRFDTENGSNGFHLKKQNGLLPIREEKRGFDYIVGNPPYGTESLGNATTKAERHKLEKALENNFALWQNRSSLSSIPVEVLFLERFIQLAARSDRPGYVAIVIPDGVLANARLQYARDWMLDTVTINGIISLPRKTFQSTGTTAKTCLLLMTCGRAEAGHRVFIATADNLDDSLTRIVRDWRKFWSQKRFVAAGHNVSVVEQHSPEFLSRMDPAYWQPETTRLLTGLKKNFVVRRLADLVDKRIAIVTGDHVRGSRGESKGYDLDSPYEYYETVGFTETGYDTSRIKRCSANAYRRLSYTAVRKDDILVSCAGVGGVGKARACFINHQPKQSCTGDVFILRLPSPLAEIVYLLLKSKFGRAQIERLCNGTGTLNINASELMSLEIPVLEKDAQLKMARDLSSIWSLHSRAMKIKAKRIKDGVELPAAENDKTYLRLMQQAAEAQTELVLSLERTLESNRTR